MLAANSLFAAQDSGEQIKDLLEDLTENGVFSGSIAVILEGRTVLSDGFGLANAELDVANTPTTKIRIGSITKPFTAMAIMLLQDRGALSVEDSVESHLRDIPAHWRGLTIRQLLNHTSGLAHPWKLQELRSKMMLPRTTDEVLSMYSDLPLVSDPGTEYHYSGIGYFLLAQVIESVSGKPYHAFLEENIFDPLGMYNTGAGRPELLIKNRASGYEVVNGALANATPVYLPTLTGGGDLYSTVEDLQRWHAALAGKKLLSAKAYDQMFQPGLNDYGFGWRIQSHNGIRMVMHTGGMPGFYAVFMSFPELDSCVIILANRTEIDETSILDLVMPLVLGANSGGSIN